MHIHNGDDLVTSNPNDADDYDIRNDPIITAFAELYTVASVKDKVETVQNETTSPNLSTNRGLRLLPPLSCQSERDAKTTLFIHVTTADVYVVYRVIFTFRISIDQLPIS